MTAPVNGNNSASLSWNADPASRDVTGHELYRDASGFPSAMLIAIVAGTTLPMPAAY